MTADRKDVLAALAVLAVDQISKIWVTAGAPAVFSARQTAGIVFGFDLPGTWDFYVVAPLLLAFIFLHIRYLRASPANLGGAFVIGGAVSNLADRLAGGTVTDFLNLGFTTMNFADLAIFAGLGIIIYRSEA